MHQQHLHSRFVTLIIIIISLPQKWNRLKAQTRLALNFFLFSLVFVFYFFIYQMLMIIGQLRRGQQHKCSSTPCRIAQMIK